MESYVTIELAGPPRGKERPRATIRHKYKPVTLPGGKVVYRKTPVIGTYTPEDTGSYEYQLGIQGNLAMRGKKMLLGAIKCEILAVFAVPESWTKLETASALAGEIRPTGKPDWDNIAKVTDALNGIVWKDDAQIVEGRIQKFYGERSFLHIEVYA